MDDFAGRSAIYKAAGLKKGLVLDIGMGDCGCMSFFLAKKGFDVIGIDRSPKAVHDSRKNAEKQQFKGTFKAKLANAEGLPFKDSEFDAIVAYDSIHHMDDVEKVIDEMFRVCKKGGIVLISDPHEKGQNSAGCKFDEELPKRIMKSLAEHIKSVRKFKTKHNMTYICEKT
ncbi:MAG: class I SAM-dependent methyltransferase [Nitrospiraceae bacterium]|nr:class I SAM-dependent methyltransferase [Nitrospiraceae bacterium]